MSGSTEGGAPSSHQLDFYQAMSDFKLMFPNMDEEVIEAVLRANEGAVDGTIDQLLTMNTDFGADQLTAAGAAVSTRGQPPLSAKLKRIVELSGRNKVTSEASSSSYDGDASRSSFGRHLASKSSVKSSFGSAVKSSLGSDSAVQRPRKAESQGLSSISTNLSEDLLDTTTDDSRVFSSSVDVRDGVCGGDGFTPSHQSWDDDSFLPAAPAPPIPPRSPLLSAPPLPPKMSLLGAAGTCGRGINGSPTTLEQKKMTTRHWDPPLLGKLPDDFLRLEIGPSTPAVFKTSPSSTQLGMFMSHSAHEATQTRASSQQTSSPLSSTRVRPTRLNSERGHTKSHHQSSTGKSHRSSHDGVLSGPHSCECQRHLCGAITMHERLPNSKRRLEINADTWQMLEDERLALVLQSEEFLAELKQNEDFMRSLEHERQLRNSGEEAQGILPEKSPHPDDSAEFRTLLKHIGDTSKKKLIAAAQKFFAKCKKKSQKPILKDTVAPSTINLLDDEETENKDSNDENFQFTDEQYKWWSQQ